MHARIGLRVTTVVGATGAAARARHNPPRVRPDAPPNSRNRRRVSIATGSVTAVLAWKLIVDRTRTATPHLARRGESASSSITHDNTNCNDPAAVKTVNSSPTGSCCSGHFRFGEFVAVVVRD